jgi:hypothetical protein
VALETAWLNIKKHPRGKVVEMRVQADFPHEIENKTQSLAKDAVLWCVIFPRWQGPFLPFRWNINENGWRVIERWMKK